MKQDLSHQESHTNITACERENLSFPTKGQWGFLLLLYWRVKNTQNLFFLLPPYRYSDLTINAMVLQAEGSGYQEDPFITKDVTIKRKHLKATFNIYPDLRLDTILAWGLLQIEMDLLSIALQALFNGRCINFTTVFL